MKEDINKTNQLSMSYTDEEIKIISHIKRFLELWTMKPNIQKLSDSDLQNEARKYNLDINIKEIECLYNKSYILKENKDIPDCVKLYRRFIIDKLDQRTYLQLTECKPQNIKFAAWRTKQVNRCWWDFGLRNMSIIHAPLFFELSKGCSVGCPFCGLSSEKLTGIFKNTQDNFKLWKEILNVSHDIIGDAAGTGALYYATEPFDNPNYEEFVDMYYKQFGKIPQLTTAACLRDIERTRKFLKKVRNLAFQIHRFSILSLDILEQVFTLFSPEELVFVELLPQFCEAPENRFSNSGRNFSVEKLGEGCIETPETISCISGFVVNMVDKDIRLITPGRVSKNNPTGEIILVRKNFTDSKDFSLKVNNIIEEYMSTSFLSYDNVSIKSNLTFFSDSKILEIKNDLGFSLIFNYSDNPLYNIFNYILSFINNDTKSCEKIAEHLLLNYKIPSQLTYLCIKKLFENSILTGC